MHHGNLGLHPAASAAVLEAATDQTSAAADIAFSGRPMPCASAVRQLKHYRCAPAPVADVPAMAASPTACMAGMGPQNDDDLAPSAPAAGFHPGWLRSLLGAARPAGVFWLRQPPPGRTRTAPRPPRAAHAWPSNRQTTAPCPAEAPVFHWRYDKLA